MSLFWRLILFGFGLGGCVYVRVGDTSSFEASQGTWPRRNVEKALTLAENLAYGFQQHPSENEPEEEQALIQLLEIPYQLEPSQTQTQVKIHHKQQTSHI
jgi:hypothetical protein